jgi:hypothetical protein
LNLIVQPNPSPTLGTYPNITVRLGQSATSTPSAPAADANNNLAASPYSVTPTTFPGGGTISVDPQTGAVTATAISANKRTTKLGVYPVLDTCGAAAVQIFTITVTFPAVNGL